MNNNNNNNNKKPTLPLDLIREILLRLSVRSVLRFKCVCKSWLSLISDPQFGDSHYDLAAAPSYRLLLKSNDFYAQSIDLEAPFIVISRASRSWNHLRGVNLLLPPPSPPLSRPPRCFSNSEYEYDESRNEPEIWGSCKGFILLCYPKGNFLSQWDLILWNPSIGLHKRLPNFDYPYSTGDFFYGFGYDPSTHDYLTIIIAFESGNHIFSFKTNSWNKFHINVPHSYGGYQFRAGLFLNGALHWFLNFKDDVLPMRIIAFDLIQRSFSEIPLFDYYFTVIYMLGAIGGCLSVCCRTGSLFEEETEIWVMKEYKVKSSWTKSFVLPAHDLFFYPICITRDGEIFGANREGLEKRNDKGELLELLTYDVDELFYRANMQPAIYRESLLLLPAVIRKTKEDEHKETSEDDQH